MYKTNAPSEERALKVSDAVIVGVERAGLVPVRGNEVTAASRELADEGADYCDQPACARAVAERVGADYAVFVSVLDKDGQFEIEVLGTDSEPITASPFGTFRSMTRRVSGLVETSIREAVNLHGGSEEEAVPAPAEGPSEPAATAPPPVAPEEETSTDPDDSGKGIAPAPFIVSTVLTGALAAAYVPLEVIGYKKDKEGASAESLKPLQTSNRVILGCGAAGLVTSVVLFFLTDFDRDEEEAPKSAHWILVPTPATNGGGLVLEGRF